VFSWLEFFFGVFRKILLGVSFFCVGGGGGGDWTLHMKT